MKNLANLNSSEWCDIIFEGKNQNYGAFKLRQSAWKRHILAFGIILLGVIFISFLPMIISTVKANIATNKVDMGDIEYTISEIETHKEELIAEVIQPVEMPAPPKYKAMEKFVPPVIVEDDQASEEDLIGMSELIEKKGVEIGSFRVENGSTDNDAIRKELATLITGEGTGKGGQPKDQIFINAEFMPEFPGGETEMYKYIYDNIVYPVVDQEMGNAGRATIRFVVTKTGEISDIQVIKGVSPGCDREAVRVIKGMPKWVPGKQNGVAVAVYFNLPIVFRLK
ncbi:MAG: TonB family protein [Tannerella sp.]|jgi:protein TonB|nr:TonB family protein [Tannerella sp.]